MQLTNQQRDLIIGTLLGDGNLQTETQGRTWRYRALQKAEHQPYLDHKYTILKDYCFGQEQARLGSRRFLIHVQIKFTKGFILIRTFMILCP
jgi:hypothetical protein